VETVNANRKLTRRGNALLLVVGLALAAGVGFTIRERARVTAEMRAVSDAWVTHVRAGRLQEAWALLATDARRATPPPALSSALSVPALRAAPDVQLDQARASSPASTGCVHGRLLGGEPADGLTVFLVYEGRGWRVRDVKLYEGELPRGPFACP
jgi:hypothetical protein